MYANIPLLVTGAARGGTTLLARILDSHPAISVASDPFFPIFKNMRDCIVQQHDNLRQTLSPTDPLVDYYFRHGWIAVLDAILTAPPHTLLLSQDDLTSGLKKVRQRASHESPDIIPFLRYIDAQNYADLFQQALQCIEKARGNRDTKVIGTKEVWCLEFFPLWRKSMPNAKCIAIIRDPRAILASMQNFWRIDPSQVPHPLSMLRSWRKYIALLYFLKKTLPNDCLKILRYEDCVTKPEVTARALCTFLHLDFHPAMLDCRNFKEYTSGGVWSPNTSYMQNMHGFDTSSLTRWQDSLPAGAIALTEYTCGSEMNLCGYTLMDECTQFQTPAMLQWYIDENDKNYSWRCDTQNIVTDMGHEMFRKNILASSVQYDISIIRQCFIFKELFDKLKSKSLLFAW